MKKYYLLFILFQISTYLFSQKEANNWYFGRYAGVTFNSGAPVALTNGALTTSEGSSTISDKNGNLIFYTDGITVWDRNHNQMPNGTGLTGDPSSAQSALIVPQPGNPNLFIIFTVAAEGKPAGFGYSIVDMTLNGGLGDVITASKNTQLFTPSTEKVTAVRHSNGLYVWVIATGMYTNRHYVYLVDCNGVGAPIISDVGTVEVAPGWGYLCVSPNGKKLAAAMSSNGFELYDFDNTTGVISNPILLSNPGSSYGVSFSPDNNLLYGLRINGGDIFQWNLQAGSPANIISSVVNLGIAAGTGGSGYKGGAIQQGPDGKLYMVQYNQPYLMVINNPNTIGTGCNIQFNAVDLLGRNAILGLPPFIINYLDTSTVSLINSSGVCAGSATSFSIVSNSALLDSVRWDFGDPASGVQNTSTLLTPTHTYVTSNSYTVRLIRHIKCISDTSYRTINILGASFSSQDVSICPGASYTTVGGEIISTPGTYKDTLTTINGCDSIITTNLSLIPNMLTVSADTAICVGSSAQLTAAGGELSYEWTPATGLSNANIANPIATPTSTTKYVVHTYNLGENLIANGDFESGNASFSSQYQYSIPNPLDGPGHYYVGTSITNGWFPGCADHTPSGTGNMLIADGANGSSGVAAGSMVWCQTVNITPNQDYAFSTWLTNLNSSGSTSQLKFFINGVQVGTTQTTPIGVCQWNQFYVTWNSGSNTTASICVAEASGAQPGNDFALDDISFNALCPKTDTITITINQSYLDTVKPSICQGQNYTLPDGNSVNTAGTYTSTLSSINNCDSVIITKLSLNPVFSYTVHQTICPTDLYVLADGTTVNTSGTYPMVLATAQGCDSTITTVLDVVPPAITVSADTQICNGNSVQLDAGGGLYSYKWEPAIGLSDDEIANPIATPTQTTTYIVTTQVESGDLIGNGNFSSGNAAFSSGYNYTNDLGPEATYYVGSNPGNYHPAFATCGDHTSGTGEMMIVNGAGTPNTDVWCQTINVRPNSDYAFRAWITSVTTGSPAILQFQINGSLIGPPFNAPSTTCDWQQFYALWNSGTNTTANICIINQNTITGGNDFAIDDISFVGLCEVKDSVTITVHDLATTNVSAVICQGATYTFPSGSSSTVSIIDTSVLTDMFGCDSTVITNLLVNPTYTIDVFDTICSNGNYTLPKGNVVISAGIYVDTLSTINGCDSIILTNLTVHDTAATSAFDTICIGSTYTLPDGNNVSTSGTYPVILPNQFNCDSVVTTHLTVIDVSLSAQATDVLCNGDNTGAINSTAGGGVLPYHYILSFGTDEIDSNTTGTFNALLAGSYSIVATDNFGCSQTTTSIVNEPSALQASDVVERVKCFGESNGQINITANGATPPYSYHLSSRPANNSGEYTGLTAGNYSYTVTDAHNCTLTATTTVTEPQALLLQANPDVVSIDVGATIQLNISSNYDPATLYSWSPTEGLSCYDCANPSLNINNSIQYTISAKVDVGGNDCMAEIKVPVTIIPNYSVYIPNLFTPNGDGINDFFTIEGNKQGFKLLQIKIFNRSGEKVYESNDVHFAWDGMYRGKALDAGVFTYTLRVVFVDNHVEKLFKGSITLIR